MKNFKITNLWQKKQKQAVQTNKTARSTQIRSEFVKDEIWQMSPEDALRVTYSGHK